MAIPVLSKEEHENEMKKGVKAKIEELTFAEYQGDIKSILVFYLNKEGQIQTMRCFDSIAMPHFYLALGVLQREMEDMMRIGATEMKPRD